MKRGKGNPIFYILSVYLIILLTLPIILPHNLRGDVFHFPALQNQPLNLPTFQNPGQGEMDLLVDNFEYWDSPYNHGWKQSEPPYPVYGFGIGYATIFNTVLDLQEGSRVLNVYRLNSIFLLDTPYYKHFIIKELVTPPTASHPNGLQGINIDSGSTAQTNAILSFKFRAPLGIEPWDLFVFHIHGTTCGDDKTQGTMDDGSFQIRIKPLQASRENAIGGLNATPTQTGYYHAVLVQSGSSNAPMLIDVAIGRNFLDGSWHTVWLDLNEINRLAHSGTVPSEKALSTATQIMISGQMFRLDDIIFRATDFIRLEPPDLFETTPLYVQIFEPIRFLFLADYEASGKIKNVNDLLLDSNNFITDPNQIRNTWINDILNLDPNHPLSNDPNYTQRWLPNDPNFGIPDPVAEDYIREGFFIDSTLPIFADQNLRIGGARIAELQDHGALRWNLTIGGYGAQGVQSFLIKPLPIYPYDGMPTYILTKYQAIQAIKTFGHYHYGPLQCFALESALWNAGMHFWPHIAYIDYTPNTFEDMIVSLEVSNGFISDTRVFPISVVNYPVENYPPATQMNICARFFIVGQKNECLIMFLDPDCFIFSMAQFNGLTPSTTHLPMIPGNTIRTDQDQLIHRMTINDLPTYQYGPWIENIIDPHSGLTTLTPKFEGVLHSVVICTDNYGASAFGERPIYCVKPGTWLNHPPIVIASPSRPQVTRAGEELIVTDIIVQDPDGDELYASCNIGSVGRMAAGSYIWSMQTNFPGFYHVEVIFYDIRGGYAIMRIEVEVKPWWSF